MKFLNLTGFKTASGAALPKCFLNPAYITDIFVEAVEGIAITVVATTTGTVRLAGSVTEPIMYQLTGREQ